MATNPRLVIGSTVFDSRSDLASSDSTIVGTVLGFGNRSGKMSIVQGSSEDRVSLRIRAVPDAGEDFADCVQKVVDIMAALEDMKTEGAILESSDGEELANFDVSKYEQLGFETEWLPGDLAQTVEVVITGTKFGPEWGDGAATWSYQRNSSGRAFCVARIRATSKAAAVAIAAPLRAGTSRPVWMPDSLRVVEDTAEFESPPGDPTAMSDADFRPGEETVVFEQVPGWMAGDSVFDDVVKGTLQFRATARPRLNRRAGNSTGMNVSITGTLEYKTEKGTEFDAADTVTIGSSELPAKVVAAVQSIVAEAERRLGEGAFTPTTSLDKMITGEDGVYEITYTAVTEGPNRVLSWDEFELFEETTRDEIVDLSDGGDWEFKHKGGDVQTVQHSVTIESLGGPRGYPSPRSTTGGGWKRMYRGDKPHDVDDTGAQPVHIAEYRRNYRKVKGTSGGGGGGGKTQATPPAGHAGQFG